MGVPKAVASVGLPLGYAFNRDGSIRYFALAVGFLADAYNIPLDPSTLLPIIVVTTHASKGSPNKDLKKMTNQLRAVIEKWNSVG